MKGARFAEKNDLVSVYFDRRSRWIANVYDSRSTHKIEHEEERHKQPVGAAQQLGAQGDERIESQNFPFACPKSFRAALDQQGDKGDVMAYQYS